MLLRIEWKYPVPDGEFCGAEGILKLRSVAKSNDWDKYWEFYTTQAKGNDFLPTEAISLNLLQKLNA